MTQVPDVRTLRESERGAFLDLMSAAFDETFMFGRYLDHDPNLGLEDTIVAVLDDRIVSALQIFTRTIRLAGRAVALGGIGSVATHPDYERRGLSTQLLRRAIAEMQRRGMSLSLLFTGRVSFYERLDWIQLDHAIRVLHRSESPDPTGIEPFRDADLPAVRALYDHYNRGRDLAALRDDAYWTGQLRFAGNPQEDFLVLRRDGRLRAYARKVPFEGLTRAIEYARSDDGAEDLARLLLCMTPHDAPLFLPDAGDADLHTALESRARQLDAIVFPDQMWRVLDRAALADLDGERGAGDDAALLRRLVARPGGVFWPADRF